MLCFWLFSSIAFRLALFVFYLFILIVFLFHGRIEFAYFDPKLLLFWERLCLWILVWSFDQYHTFFWVASDHICSWFLLLCFLVHFLFDDGVPAFAFSRTIWLLLQTRNVFLDYSGFSRATAYSLLLIHDLNLFTYAGLLVLTWARGVDVGCQPRTTPSCTSWLPIILIVRDCQICLRAQHGWVLLRVESCRCLSTRLLSCRRLIVGWQRASCWVTSPWSPMLGTKPPAIPAFVEQSSRWWKPWCPTSYTADIHLNPGCYIFGLLVRQRWQLIFLKIKVTFKVKCFSLFNQFFMKLLLVINDLVELTSRTNCL